MAYPNKLFIALARHTTRATRSISAVFDSGTLSSKSQIPADFDRRSHRSLALGLGCIGSAPWVMDGCFATQPYTHRVDLSNQSLMLTTALSMCHSGLRYFFRGEKQFTLINSTSNHTNTACF